VILGLGSNLGQKSKNLCNTLKLISGFCKVEKVSPIYKTESLLKDDQDSYFNLCALIKTNLSPLELLYNLKVIERKLGRTSTGRWYTRVMDIDIIDFNGAVYDYDKLQIPHSGIESRSFVLYPILDICPEYTHPVSCRSVSDMVKILKDDLGIKRVGKALWRL